MYEFSPARGGFHAAVAGTRPPSGSWRRWSAPAPPSPNTATKLCAQDRPPPRTTTTLQPAKPRYPDLSPAPAVRIRASGRSAPCGLRRQRCVALRPAWCHGRWPRALSAAGTGGRAAHGGARVQAGCVVTGALGLRCGWEREERTPSRPPGLGDDHRRHPGRRRQSGSSSRPSPRIAAETPGQRRADSATRADAIDFLDSIASEPPGRAGERGGGMKAPRATARCTRRR